MALDYYAIDDVLAEFDPTESVAFLHGSLTARLISGERLSRTDWLDAVRSLLEIEQAFSEAENNTLQALYDETLSGLTTEKTGLPPLVPENAPMADRMEALADWCAAFVSTLGMVGKLQAPDEEDQELLTDLVAISQLDSASADEPDAEEDFSALLQYARMANRHFYERFTPPSEETPVH